jgi:hypothetical protein
MTTIFLILAVSCLFVGLPIVALCYASHVLDKALTEDAPCPQAWADPNACDGKPMWPRVYKRERCLLCGDIVPFRRDGKPAARWHSAEQCRLRQGRAHVVSAGPDEPLEVA